MNLLDRVQPNRSWLACRLSVISATGKLLLIVGPTRRLCVEQSVQGQSQERCLYSRLGSIGCREQ